MGRSPYSSRQQVSRLENSCDWPQQMELLVNPPVSWLQRDVPGLTRAAVPVLVHPGWQIGLKARHGNLSHRLPFGTAAC